MEIKLIKYQFFNQNTIRLENSKLIYEKYLDEQKFNINYIPDLQEYIIVNNLKDSYFLQYYKTQGYKIIDNSDCILIYKIVDKAKTTLKLNITDNFHYVVSINEIETINQLFKDEKW